MKPRNGAAAKSLRFTSTYPSRAPTIPPMMAYRERSTTSPESHPRRRVRVRVSRMAAMNASRRKMPNDDTGNVPNGVGIWNSTGFTCSPPVFAAPAVQGSRGQHAGPRHDRGVSQIEHGPAVDVEVIHHIAEVEAIHDVPERPADHEAGTPLSGTPCRPCAPIVEEDREHGQGERHRDDGGEPGEQPEGNPLIVYDRKREDARDQHPRSTRRNEPLDRPFRPLTGGEAQHSRAAKGPGDGGHRATGRCRSSRSLHLMQSRA